MLYSFLIRRCFFFFFFFSSRRRHTRSLCDWSSDVCSSDLPAPDAERGAVELEGGRHGKAHGVEQRVTAADRSEERRVGKECRSRWSPDHEKKKEQEMEKENRQKKSKSKK